MFRENSGTAACSPRFSVHWELQTFLFSVTAPVPTLPNVSVCKSYSQKPVGPHLVQNNSLHRESVIIQSLQKSHLISFQFESNTLYEAVILFHQILWWNSLAWVLSPSVAVMILTSAAGRGFLGGRSDPSFARSSPRMISQGRKENGPKLLVVSLILAPLGAGQILRPLQWMIKGYAGDIDLLPFLLDVSLGPQIHVYSVWSWAIHKKTHFNTKCLAFLASLPCTFFIKDWIF